MFSLLFVNTLVICIHYFFNFKKIEKIIQNKININNECI